MGTQRNRLDETVLLSTQNTCLNFYANYFCLTGPMLLVLLFVLEMLKYHIQCSGKAIFSVYLSQ